MLANISSMPSAARQSSFDFSHHQDHVEIARAIQKSTGTKMQIYPIHPADDRDAAWMRLHQSFHDDMHKVLGTQGRDLTGEMDQAWYNNNYQEHVAVRAKLGI